MPDRFAIALKLVCLGLAGLLVYQFLRLAAWRDPLADLNVPAPLSAMAAPKPQPQTKETNSVPPAKSGKKSPEIPPAAQARVDRITQSEILGPVIRPLPMALLGIAGKDAFLRAPDGRTGLLREGEELGAIKLLRIGTNRVLIEHEQQQKELTLFSGFGSEPLLPKERPKP